MYLRGGMGALNPGYARPGTVVLRVPLNVRRRTRGMGQTCSGGGAWDPGLQVCCAPPGTPPMQDPCSILNNPGFIQQQNTQIQQDIATSGPLEYNELVALTSVPVNIGQDAVRCQSNPGATFVDSMGVTITCPSPSHTDITTGGQPMSTYSTTQLAAMLNASYGSKSPATGGNAPVMIPVPVIHSDPIFNPGGGGSTTNGGGSTSGGSGGSSDSGGSGGGSGGGNTGGGGCVAPNTLVNGVCTAPAAPASGTDLVSQIETSLSGTFTIAGMAVPIWALVGGGLAALWFLGGKK